MKQQRHERNKSNWPIVAAAALCTIAGCRQLPVVSTGYDGTGKDFVVEYRGSVRVSKIEIWSASKQVYLWSWEIGDENSFDYGVLPETAKQLFPSTGGLPRAVAEGEELVVSVLYFYDSAWPPAACVGSDTKAFKRLGNKFHTIPLTSAANRIPKWKSDKERQEYVQKIRKEVEDSGSLFLKAAYNPDATGAQRHLIAALKKAVGLDDPKEAYIELRNIDAFCPYSADLSDLSLLSDFTNITTLVIPHNGVSDIAPLANLTQLTFLRLENNQISDLSPLSNLKHLTDLRIDNNSVSNLMPLSKLNQMYRLQASNNQITDVVALSTLTKLNDLDLSRNHITDIAPLKGLQELFDVNLSYNRITNIWPLAQLQTNNIAGCDVPMRTTVRTYGRLNISQNPISDRNLLGNFRKAKVDVTE